MMNRRSSGTPRTAAAVKPTEWHLSTNLPQARYAAIPCHNQDTVRASIVPTRFPSFGNKLPDSPEVAALGSEGQAGFSIFPWLSVLGMLALLAYPIVRSAKGISPGISVGKSDTKLGFMRRVKNVVVINNPSDNDHDLIGDKTINGLLRQAHCPRPLIPAFVVQAQGSAHLLRGHIITVIRAPLKIKLFCQRSRVIKAGFLHAGNMLPIRLFRKLHINREAHSTRLRVADILEARGYSKARVRSPLDKLCFEWTH